MVEHKHLHRLERVWVANPRYFITICTEQRKPILADAKIVKILVDEWTGALNRRGWAIGSYVVMPDHIHFFCTDGEMGTTLSRFIGAWKEWTSKFIARQCGMDSPIWQKGFFDHLLRSDESYSEKWNYVRNNPVRAGLVRDADDWPFSGFVHYR
jgi:REP element-mobilizing transposase RayT